MAFFSNNISNILLICNILLLFYSRLSCGDVFCRSCIHSWWEKEMKERFKSVKCHPPLKIARSSDELLFLRNRISRLGRSYEKALANYCPHCSAQIRRAPMSCANFASFITDCLVVTQRSDDQFSNTGRSMNIGPENLCFKGLFTDHDKE